MKYLEDKKITVEMDVRTWDKIQRQMKESYKREVAIDIMRRSVNYLRGYLNEGYIIESEERFDGNPLIIIMKVWWKPEEKEEKYVDVSVKIIEKPKE